NKNFKTTPSGLSNILPININAPMNASTDKINRNNILILSLRVCTAEATLLTILGWFKIK
ncbi:hypothetical protein, partial [Pseudomonas sp. HY2-MNA-CIBAN-0224]|uniref:hypothetical protein n=1 Tax=Pseudomonas sp. HY2-MNA-CIBAN-0224 TaxID=3140471 RepID=UPI00332FCBED